MKILVDLFEITSAIGDQNNGIESFYYLNVETGEVEFFTADVLRAIESDDPQEISALCDWQKDEVIVAKRITADDGKRFIPIPRLDSSVSFRFMEDFIDQVSDTRLRGKLGDALRRKRPFRSFKDVLSYYPEVEDWWYSFRNEKLRLEAVELLSSIRHERIEFDLYPGGK